MPRRLQHFVQPCLSAACLVGMCLPLACASANAEGLEVIDHGGKVRWPTAMAALPDGRVMGCQCEGT